MQGIRLLVFIIVVAVFTSCSNSSTNFTATGDTLAKTAVLIPVDSSLHYAFIDSINTNFEKAMQQPLPVLLCRDSLTSEQQLAQLIVLSDSSFAPFIRNKEHLPYKTEVFGVYPAKESDLSMVKSNSLLKDCYRVELYNYTMNKAAIAIADIQQQRIITEQLLQETQPDIPPYLKRIAIKLAVNSPEVQKALGFKPGDADALMASTKTALNNTKCERSGHLCVAPTFLKDDKALWAIIDLTDLRLAGIRWTYVGKQGYAAPVTEHSLQNDKINSCFCEISTPLEQKGWKMNYMLTSSDGLRIADVSFNGKPVLQSAKLVDWHVSYSGTDGFGYSDAVGCPSFSQAAVVALEPPQVAVLLDDNKQEIGFVLEQTFRSQQWPVPCNYNYKQRYEFYNDGKFRVACASLGRGCGNNGTYRPVFRIAFADKANNFYEWKNNEWAAWQKEQWQLQTELTAYTANGAEYKIGSAEQSYFVVPGQGQFKDGGRGDNAFVYITRNETNRNEGESDLVTIGPCCNTDYHQGPEKFIEPNPEPVINTKLVLWYVAQLKNDDRPGMQYCWAETFLQKGKLVTKTYPCFAGPMFIPVVK